MRCQAGNGKAQQHSGRTTFVLSCGGLRCKNCGDPILLTSPKYPGVPPRHLWPRGGQTRNFLCRQCGHATAYAAEDAVGVENIASDERPKACNVLCIEVSCGTRDCDAPIRIHTVVALGTESLLSEARRLVSLSTTDQIGCGSLHFLKGSLREAEVLGAYFDTENWELAYL